MKCQRPFRRSKDGIDVAEAIPRILRDNPPMIAVFLDISSTDPRDGVEPRGWVEDDQYRPDIS